jgi:predicted glycoside hydrolase/deacetylase ChbG (UPF0249 family)
VGVHLTLIEERPLLDPQEIPSLIGSNGKFHPHAVQFTRRYLSGKINQAEVRKELEAQIEKILAAGITPSHLDSHQHVHMLPGVSGIAVALGRKYGITAMRVPKEFGIFGGFAAAPLGRIVQAMILSFFCQKVNGSIERKTDYFAGFLFGGNLNKKNLHRVLSALPQFGTCEIMCHPGLEDSQSRYAHWNYHWQEELEALLDDEIKRLIREKGIQLISYRELRADTPALSIASTP